MKRKKENDRINKEIAKSYKERHTKRINYGDIVRNAYAPKISQDKVDELQRRLNELDHPFYKQKLIKKRLEDNNSNRSKSTIMAKIDYRINVKDISRTPNKSPI